MKKVIGLALLLNVLNNSVLADEYTIDGTGAGMHSFVQFKASHMGISALWGRFNDITGSFTYDAEDIESSKIEVFIDPASLDSNHAARDAHLTSGDYLDVANFPESKFVSTNIKDKGNGVVGVTGDFSFHGVTKSISFDMTLVGEGETRFGDYRVGFEGSTVVEFGAYGIEPMSIELLLSVEGVAL